MAIFFQKNKMILEMDDWTWKLSENKNNLRANGWLAVNKQPSQMRRESLSCGKISEKKLKRKEFEYWMNEKIGKRKRKEDTAISDFYWLSWVNTTRAVSILTFTM